MCDTRIRQKQPAIRLFNMIVICHFIEFFIFHAHYRNNNKKNVYYYRTQTYITRKYS